jgi:hypothetical protein
MSERAKSLRDHITTVDERAADRESTKTWERAIPEESNESRERAKREEGTIIDE